MIQPFPPVTTLLDRSEGQALPLTEAIAQLYGGSLSFPLAEGRPYVIANFVTTLDGVITFQIPGKSGGGLVSGGNQPDRFIMGLLRACSDAVVSGAGTLRALPSSVLTPGHIFKPAADEYGELRRVMGKPAQPWTVVITGSGKIDVSHPAFHAPGVPVLIVTSEAGAQNIRQQNRQIADNIVIKAVARGSHTKASQILDAIVEVTGARLVVVEGGAKTLADFMAEDRLDELFLSLAPQIAGRDREHDRPALVEGHAFMPDTAPWAKLVSIKSDGKLLYLRYDFQSKERR